MPHKIITDEFLKKYKGKQPSWGYSGLGYVVYKRTYSRLKEDNTYEEWYETVARCINGSQEIGADYTKAEAERLFDYMFNLKCNMAGRMLWQLGTSHIKRYGGNSLLNCWATKIDTPESFCFLFENLMLGGGVGFSVSREDIYQLPNVKEGVNVTHINAKDADFIVPDSREGWVSLLRRLLKCFFITGRSFTYSTILVRGYGERIQGFGGTASGPGILVEGIDKIVKIFQGRETKKLRSIDVLDICNIIGSIVVSGNVRRCLPKGSLVHTSKGLIPIENIKKGDRVLTSKGLKKVLNNFYQGKQNTITIKTQDGSFECTPEHRMAVLNGVDSYTWKEAKELQKGDRLISPRESLEGIETNLPEWNYINPSHSTTCQDITIPKLDKDMAWFLGVFHADGYTYPNYKDNGFNAYVSLVFSENEYNIAEKAKKQLERFGLKNVILKHRKNENSWSVSCVSKQIAWYFDKNLKQAKKEIRVPDFILQAKEEIKLAYVSGVFDGDGHIGRPLCILATVYKNFALDIQRLLYSCGMESRFYSGKDEKRLAKGWQKIYKIHIITLYSKNKFIDSCFSLKLITRKDKSRLCNSFPVEWIKDKYWPNPVRTVDSYEKKFRKKINLVPVEVVSLEESSSLVETYDIEVEDNHEFFCNGYLTHNSAQVSIGDPDDYLFMRAKRWDLGDIPNWRALSNNTIYADDYSHLTKDFWEGYEGNGEPYGLFNVKLAQTVGRAGEHKKDNGDLVNPCCEIILANMECCNLSEVYLNNVESKEELKDIVKLLYKTQKAVCTLPFIHEETNKIVHKNMRIGVGMTGICQSLEKLEWLDETYKDLKLFDKEWSKKKDYYESIRLTTVKPSGTLSLLAGATPGVHPAYSQYYIRRVRMASDDKMVKVCKDLGYHTEYVKNFDGTENHNTTIVEFPCYSGDNVIVAKDMSAVKQLELVKKMQEIWSDNSVSVTVYYKKEELPEIKKWLKENYKNSLKTVSFLLHQEHGFKQAPYEEITKEKYKELMKNIKPIKYSKIDGGTDLDVEECAGGVCPIK